MSKLIYLLSIMTLSFLMPTAGYSSAIPTTTTTTTHYQQKVKKKKAKKKRLRRKKPKGIKKAQSVGSALMIILGISIPIAGIVLLIVGLAMQIPGLWIAGIVILGIILILAAVFLIMLATSGPWE